MICRGQDCLQTDARRFKNTRSVITMAGIKALARSAHLIEPEADAMIDSYLITRLT